jgi:hypothetical protein
MVHAKPVFPVPARTGMASSTEAASENGVSLFHAVVKIYADLDAKLPTYHFNEPYRGAGTSILSGLIELKVFERQHKPPVQFASAPVA